MRDEDLQRLEAGLQVRLPNVFRKFILEHGATLANAKKVLRDEVVLEVDPERVIRLNEGLRSTGYFKEEQAIPWPLRFVALTDNGAGDHLCIRADEDSGALHLFDHESGEFQRSYKSLDDYLVKLEKRVAAFKKSARGKSDLDLIEALGVLGDSSAFGIIQNDLEQPVTPAKLKAKGVDLNRLERVIANLLEAITGIPATSWRLSIDQGEYPNQVQVSFESDEKSGRPGALTNLHLFEGRLELGLKVAPEDRKLKRDQLGIDWRVFESTLCELFEVIARRPVLLMLGTISCSFSKIGYGSCVCSYQVNAA